MTKPTEFFACAPLPLPVGEDICYIHGKSECLRVPTSQAVVTEVVVHDGPVERAVVVTPSQDDFDPWHCECGNYNIGPVCDCGHPWPWENE